MTKNRPVNDRGDSGSSSRHPQDCPQDNGWFVALDNNQVGPVSATEAWHLIAGMRSNTQVRVWHPSLSTWQTLPFQQAQTQNTGQPRLQLRIFRLRNASYITWLACSITPFFILGAALLQAVQDLSILFGFLAIVAYFGWWLYLEQSGIRLDESQLVFPLRMGFWPYPPIRLKRLQVTDISGFESWSSGHSVYWFRINVGTKLMSVLLDDVLHRDILTLALEAGLPSGAQAA